MAIVKDLRTGYRGDIYIRGEVAFYDDLTISMGTETDYISKPQAI